MRGQEQLMSSARTGIGRDDWGSPESVLERVRRVAPIGLDPCCDEQNTTTTGNLFTETTNGLLQDWRQWTPERTLCYVNPPYSKMALWADKMASEASSGVPIIALVGARPDTRWWRAMWSVADVVAFWRGRLRFVGAPSCAPFPSALFGINVSQRRFKAAFGDVAEVVVP